MIDQITEKLGLNPASELDASYLKCIQDLASHEKVQSMKKYMQHKNIDCFEHCLHVSYGSYCICRKLGLDWRSAARGGLLHDFFLYDWHLKKRTGIKELHGFKHPDIAMSNAMHYFNINKTERDIIYNHMWPLTFRLPQYKETYIIVMVDKYCALMESCNLWNSNSFKLLKLPAASLNHNLIFKKLIRGH